MTERVGAGAKTETGVGTGRGVGDILRARRGGETPGIGAVQSSSGEPSRVHFYLSATG